MNCRIRKNRNLCIRYFSFIIKCVCVTSLSYAANCPNDEPELSYKVANGALTSNKINGTTWEWQLAADVTVTLNCDVDPCLTEVGGGATIYCMKDEWKVIDGKPQKTGATYEAVLGGAAETEGVQTGYVNMCDKGNTHSFLIDSGLEQDSFEPTRVEYDWEGGDRS